MLENTTDRCEFCDLSTHTSNMHKCGICGIIGVHSARVHCKRCGSLEHNIDVHCDTHSNCVIVGPHYHPCEYCDGGHMTKNHKCEMVNCGQKGHSRMDHNIKCVCHICQIKGHLNNVLHYKCHNCKSMVIYSEHIKCIHCNTCTIPNFKHLDKCDSCGSCCIDISGGGMDNIIMCINCYRINNGLKYVLISNGIIAKKI